MERILFHEFISFNQNSQKYNICEHILLKHTRIFISQSHTGVTFFLH